MTPQEKGLLKKSRSPLKRTILHGINYLLKTRSPEMAALVDADNDQLPKFLEHTQKMDNPSVLELATRRSDPNTSTSRRSWVPHAGKYVGTDYQNGLDVDQVADVHRLSQVFGEESFDIIISCSGFEHFKYPFVAAHEIMKTLKVGGVLYIQTHQTYPLHAFPYDYFRYSCDGLRALFGTKNGFKICGTSYHYPAQIMSSRLNDLILHHAYLNSSFFGVKEDKTPEEFQYEIGGDKV